VAALVIWTLDMQEFVLFVFGGVLELLPKIQFACTGVLSSFGPLACRSLSCLLWQICKVCIDIAFQESAMSPLGWYIGGAED
jgi:F0F1-type ATP synthase assembly protein I